MWFGLANTETRGFIIPLWSSVHLQYMSHKISLSLKQSCKRNSDSAWNVTTFVQKLNYHSKCVHILRRQKDGRGEKGKKKGGKQREEEKRELRKKRGNKSVG